MGEIQSIWPSDILRSHGKPLAGLHLFKGACSTIVVLRNGDDSKEQSFSGGTDLTDKVFFPGLEFDLSYL